MSKDCKLIADIWYLFSLIKGISYNSNEYLLKIPLNNVFLTYLNDVQNLSYLFVVVYIVKFVRI